MKNSRTIQTSHSDPDYLAENYPGCEQKTLDRFAQVDAIRKNVPVCNTCGKAPMVTFEKKYVRLRCRECAYSVMSTRHNAIQLWKMMNGK